MIVEHCILLIMNVELEQGAQPVPVPQAMDRVHPDDGEGMDNDDNIPRETPETATEYNYAMHARA